MKIERLNDKYRLINKNVEEIQLASQRVKEKIDVLKTLKADKPKNGFMTP